MKHIKCQRLFKFSDSEVKVLNKRTGTYIVKEKTAIVSVTKSVDTYLRSLGFELSYNKAVKTNSSYYSFDVNAYTSVEIRVSDHSKAQRGIAEDKSVSYSVNTYPTGIGFTLYYNIDGVNLKSDEFKKQYQTDVKRVVELYSMLPKVNEYCLVNKEKVFTGSIKDFNEIVGKQFDIKSTMLESSYMSNVYTSLLKTPEIKQLVERAKTKTDPMGGLSSYTATNGVYIMAFRRDKATWNVSLPNAVQKSTVGMTKEEAAHYKQQMKKDAVAELEAKLVAMGK